MQESLCESQATVLVVIRRLISVCCNEHAEEVSSVFHPDFIVGGRGRSAAAVQDGKSDSYMIVNG
jgi:hypothetical protein